MRRDVAVQDQAPSPLTSHLRKASHQRHVFCRAACEVLRWTAWQMTDWWCLLIASSRPLSIRAAVLDNKEEGRALWQDALSSLSHRRSPTSRTRTGLGGVAASSARRLGASQVHSVAAAPRSSGTHDRRHLSLCHPRTRHACLRSVCRGSLRGHAHDQRCGL